MYRNYGSYINQPTPQSEPIFGREKEMKNNVAGFDAAASQLIADFAAQGL